jgi:hypothetical protein
LGFVFERLKTSKTKFFWRKIFIKNLKSHFNKFSVVCPIFYSQIGSKIFVKEKYFKPTQF